MVLRGRSPEQRVTAEGVKIPSGAVDVREVFPPPLSARQRWLLGLSTLMLDPASGSCARAHPSAFVHPKKTPRDYRIDLKVLWDITDFGSLMSQLTWLLRRGQRGELAEAVGHPPLAWDYSRVVVLPRRALAAGFIDEATAWDLMEAAAAPVYQTYDSWGGFVRDNLAGRNAWAGRRHRWMDQHVARWWSPSLHAESPWQCIPWDEGR
jgi:hypothetical protein